MDTVAVNGEAWSHLVPLGCFVVVAACGFFDLSVERKQHWR